MQGNVVGIAGGVPGPYNAKGFDTSGVAVAWTHLGPTFNAQIAVHEIGHYLGLFHTTENNSDDNGDPQPLDLMSHDAITDTPECDSPNQLTTLDNCAGNGAGFLMFWQQPSGVQFSAAQVGFLRGNPNIGPDDGNRWAPSVPTVRLSPTHAQVVSGHHRFQCGLSSVQVR